MSLTWDAKDPDAVADYEVDWTTALAGDTIITSVFTLVVAAGLTIDSQSTTDAASTVVLSAGTAGEVATLNCRITTAGGRTLDQEVTLEIDSGLVVEGGTGMTDAEAMASVLAANAYCARRGLAWSGTKAKKEHALRRGADRLATGWAYKGAKTAGRVQAMPFPRIGCTDRDGVEIASDEMPIEMVHANIELAVFELANPGGLAPSVVPADRVRRLREKVGPLETETEFAAVPTDAAQARPVLTRVEDLIGGLLDGGSGNSLVGTAVRV